MASCTDSNSDAGEFGNRNILDKNNQIISNIDTNPINISIIHGNTKLKESLTSLKPIKIPILDGVDESLINDWNFNILHHFKIHSDPFCSVSQVLLSDFINYSKIDLNIAASFLRLVENLYNDTSYHNKMHGVMVAQKMFCLAKFVNLFDKMSILDQAAFIVAGLCHDIAHPGRTNAFYVNRLDEVSVIFNSKSVLENFHAFCTFNILQIPEANIFGNLSKKDFNYCRSRIVNLILATDMAHHAEMISNFRDIKSDKDNPNYILAIQKLIIKAADISSSVVLWEESLEWTQRLLYEFYAQGDDEAKLGLPITPQCDRSQHDQVYKNQVYFLESIVIPLYQQLEYLDTRDGKIKNICMFNAKNNLYNWGKGIKVSLDDLHLQPCSPTVDLDLLK